VQSHCDQPRQAEILARRIIGRISEPFEVDGHRLCIGTSVGIAVLGSDDRAADDIMNAADIAMYRAKTATRESAARDGRFVVFEPEMAVNLAAKRSLETDLRLALERSEFELFYQPITSAESGEVIAHEALLRWRHPIRGLLLPGDFIGVAEATGLIAPMGAWILRQACTEATGWPGNVRVAVNLSAVQFAAADLATTVAAALAQSGLAASRLELEITESMLLADICHARRVMQELSTLGVHVALDQFGAGNSAFNHLRRFRISRLKIDRSFVQELGGQGTASSRAMVAAMVALGRNLGVATTAKGVETKADGDILRALGCTDLQGYHFGRPVPASEIAVAAPVAAPAALSRRFVSAA
jgi:predicted signal transduction protein with EAL and GGDEF domain